MRYPIIGLLLIAMAISATAQQGPQAKGKAGGGKAPDDNCGILYGRNHSLSFCAPDGWELDNGILNDEGIFAVFYPKGSTWDKARTTGTFMYFNVTDLGPKDTVKSFMAADTRREMKNDPKTSVSTGESIQVGDRSFPVLEFSLGGNSGHEAVAYIGESQVLVMIVISSLNEEIFRRDYPSFVKLVKTYAFLTSDVRIKTK